MARIRSIKPEFWTSEQVMECSPNARLVFVGMWNFCDDGGNHPASAKTLKAEVLPGDDITAATVQGYVDELIAVGLIEKYEACGNLYWHVTGWHHQKIDQPTFKYIGPDGTIPEGAPKRRHAAQKSASVRQALAERSPNTHQEINDSDNPGSANTGRTFAERSPPESSRVDGKGVNPSTHQAATDDSRARAKRDPTEANGIPPTHHQRAADLTRLLRERGASLQSSDPRVIGWAIDGISDAAALFALELAQSRRLERGDPSPINAGYLDAFIRDQRPTHGAKDAESRPVSKRAKRAEELYRARHEAAPGVVVDGTADRVD